MLKLFKKKTDEPRAKLRALLGEYDLPTFPTVVVAALQKLRDSDASLASVADLLATDPGLSVRLLGTVNAAAFSLRHKVKNIHHAVSLMGSGPLESMLVSIGVRDALPMEPATGFDAGRFWSTSALRATTAKILAERVDPSRASESFTAALLQDMALPVLSHRKGDEYGRVLEQWHAGGRDLAELEREALDWDHAQVGRWMCEEWGFPEALTEAIGSHHDDPAAAELPAVNLVALLREVDPDAGVEALAESAEAVSGIPRDDMAAIIESSTETAAEIARMFG